MRGAKYPVNRLQPPATSGLTSQLISVHAAASRSGELPFGMIRLAPPIGAAFSNARGTNATLYGVFMLSRTKDSDPVDSSIIAVRPWKNAVVTAFASFTPGGITFHVCTKASISFTAPTVVGSL